jgi:23S rRNA pseudouridine1911/1915/1917 synthase
MKSNKLQLCNMLKKKISEWPSGKNDENRLRLQEAAVGLFHELPSRKSVKKAIKNGHVLLNNEIGLTSSWVVLGDVIELKLSPNNRLHQSKFNSLKIDDSDVIFEDENIIVVRKRGGVLTNGNHALTLDLMVSNYLFDNSLNKQQLYIGPAHRLDKETQGPVVFYKNLRAANWLGSAFENREISKTYLALVQGDVELKSAAIHIPIAGKTAITKIENLGTLNWPLHKRVTLIKVQLLTGRKHQIRRHLFSIGHPIVGDKLYNLGVRYSGDGLFLACTNLSFTNLNSSDRVTIALDPPRKFNKVFSKLDLP